MEKPWPPPVVSLPPHYKVEEPGRVCASAAAGSQRESGERTTPKFASQIIPSFSSLGRLEEGPERSQECYTH